MYQQGLEVQQQLHAGEQGWAATPRKGSSSPAVGGSTATAAPVIQTNKQTNTLANKHL